LDSPPLKVAPQFSHWRKFIQSIFVASFLSKKYDVQDKSWTPPYLII
jgi:hypothetical protein